MKQLFYSPLNIRKALLLSGLGVALSGHLLHAQTYCSPTFVTGCDDGHNINTFVLNGENGTSINDQNTGCALGGYDNKTSLPAVELYQGTTYTSTISTQFNEILMGVSAAVWIDLNDNGQFEPSERVAVYNQLLSLAGSSVPIVIPGNAQLGIHRMRIVVGMGMVGSNTGDGLDPCPSFLNGAMIGEVHDYRVNILTVGGSSCTDPVVHLGNDTTLCAGNSLTLDAGNPGLTYLWNDQSTNQTLVANAPGTYYVTVFDGACSGSDTVVLTGLDVPTVGSINATDMGGGTFQFAAVGASNAQTYSWDFGDGTTGTGASVQHSYASGGTYQVSLTVSNDCGQAAAQTTVQAPVGILLVPHSEMELFPNPVSDRMSVRLPNGEQLQELRIADLLGRNLLVKELSGSECTIEIALPNGLYVLEVRTSSGVRSLKLQVRR